MSSLDMLEGGYSKKILGKLIIALLTNWPQTDERTDGHAHSKLYKLTLVSMI